MATLRIYGDSFASCQRDPAITSWTTLLADKLKLPMINRAVPGSGVEYSITELYNDIQANIVNSNDIIIFVVSSFGRLNFSHQRQQPDTAAMYLHVPPDCGYRNHDWYWKNKKYIEWYLVNQNFNQFNVNHTAYISMIKDIAKLYTNCKFIILENSGYQGINLSAYPDNCLHSTISINDISKNEFDISLHSSENVYNAWTEFTIWDPRQNHFSIPNLHILTNLLFESLQNMDISNISADKFLKHHMKKITSKEEYMKVVTDNLINYNNSIFSFLKK
jgi:hypothetical protein